MYYLSVGLFVTALPLQSEDEEPDEDESTRKPSKSKSEKSSRKKKIPRPEKRKAPHSPEATSDDTRETMTVSSFFSTVNL